jgi:hypothetical protein
MYKNNKVYYYWYHHMMSNKDRNQVELAIKNKDFDTFINYYKAYNSLGLAQGRIIEEFNSFCPIVFFPSEAQVEDDNGNILATIDILNKDNFMKIDESESECG